ncbi:sigma-54-dependent Fis family transcriptional regulator [Deltaproteobacteria bacterium OttesenSCG-928-M10]|nr:sigma-54-dependent Fis family transcriptional regulator [Deltaproteobacteria bacterium OttesenSCG-928-M10]
MTIHPDKFYREISRTLLGSLDIHVSLERCLDYLRQVLPVDELVICLAADEKGIMRVFARTSPPEAGKPAEDLVLPETFWKWFKYQPHQPVTLLTDESFKSMPPHFAEFFPGRWRRAGEILVYLEVEEQVLGIMLIRALDGVFFQPEQVELLALVKEPFSMALASALTYRRYMECKNMPAPENGWPAGAKRSNVVIGENNGLREVMRLVDQVAALNNTVLILGETGSGKEVVANAIHQRSHRWAGPFVKVNCGAIPDSLIDSELFGHERGAFTGAYIQQRGRFERAGGGTIFLDEVGELSLKAQVRLLRVLTTHEIERLGGSQVVPVDIRVIAATHRDLSKLVAEGTFREDLWFRLNVFPIAVPPLRERKSDIPLLLRHFLNVKSREANLAPPPIGPRALKRLVAYDWPGNIRELENVIERELILKPGHELNFEALLPLISGQRGQAVWDSEPGRWPTLDEINLRYIRKVLENTGQRISGPGGAAEILGINPNTLRSRMYKLGLLSAGAGRTGNSAGR